MSRRKSHKQAKSGSKKPLILLILILFIGYLGFRYIGSALTIFKKDRVNIVVYGQNTAFYSIGLSDAGNYIVPFYPDLKIELPGGYGMYRVGAIGKLVELEKKPDILRRSFSQA